MAKNYDDSDGVWRTIGGRRIFIKNGEDLASAMKRSGKFKSTKKKQDDIDKKYIKKVSDAKNDDELKKADEYYKKETGKEWNALTDRDAKDLFKQLNDEGSDFTFDDEVKIEDGKIKTSVGVFMPDERGYVERELEIPIDENETYDSLEEKMRDWEDRHRDVDSWENEEDWPSKKEYSHLDASEAQLKRMNGEYKDIADLRDEYEDKVLSKSSKYTTDEQDILDHFGEDYGYDKGDNLKNLKGQIDYMRNPNESIHKTAERFVEGGGFLIYNEDIKDYLRERNIKFNDDNFFDVYKKEMADKMEKLYNSNQITNSLRQKAYQKYLKEHPASKMTFEEFKKSNK